MGTTHDAIAAGSAGFVWVAAIEGYEHLLTNHDTDTAAVVTAFAGLSGGDWTSALGGLFVDMQQEQSISPWEPLHGGGRCTLAVARTTSADTFGRDVARRAAGWSSELAATADRNDTTLTVLSAAGAASSGTAYVGTEAVAYTGKTSTTLTGCTRGKWSPFGNGSSTSDGRFAQHHRAGLSAEAVQIAATVSAQPRTWIGRWVGVWMVRVTGGVLDTVGEAQLVYAGKLAEIRDDAQQDATVLDLRHVLDVMRDASIGRQMWSAKIKEGIYLKQGMYFTLSDFKGTVGPGPGGTGGSTLTVLATGATPVDGESFVEGYYTVAGLHGELNKWFGFAGVAGDLWGGYGIEVKQTDAGWRTKVGAVMESTSGSLSAFFLGMPRQVASFLGFSEGEEADPFQFVISDGTTATGTTTNLSVTGSDPALKSQIFKLISGTDGLNFEIDTFTGEIVDQFDTMPASLRPPSRTVNIVSTPTDRDWGLFVFDNNVLMRGSWELGSAAPTEFTNCLAQNLAGAFAGDLEAYSVPYDGSTASTITVRQILVFESTEATYLKSLAYSTGTAGYNSDEFDGLGFGAGLGLPGGLLGAEYENSIDGLPGADESLVVVIDKPMTLADLLRGDLVLRLAFPVWRDQHLRFAAWRTPDTSGATLTLTEANKAEPSGSATQQRSSTALTDEWQRPIVKIQFNRDFADLSSDGFRDTITLEDRTAIDDAGGDGAVVTVKARNTFGQFEQTGAAVEALLPAFLAAMPLFSRPARKVTRSIDLRYFESIGVGDVVLFSDSYARDPETGLRGVAVRPAVVVKHWWTPGGMQLGADPDKPADMAGGVELFFVDQNAVLGDALYAPAADIDHTYTTAPYLIEGDVAGYIAGYEDLSRTILCVARAYNQSVSVTINGSPVLFEEDTDATLFTAGYAVRIIERDPADINNPQVWTTTVVSQTGDLITLAAPLTGFDSAKQYRVVFDDFDACTTAQKLKAFQADPTDGLILDASGAYLYKSASAERNWTANASPPVVEMIPALTYADGAGRDVGHESALVLLLDNLLDYKTGINQPVLFSARSNTANAGAYQLVYLAPIWLTREGLSNAVTRELAVSLLHRSTDGTSATVRVSLCRARPTSTSNLNVSRGSVYAEMTRATTSTSYVASTVSYLDASVKDPDTGRAWLLIECSYKATTMGIRQLQEGPRIQPTAWVL